MELVKLKAKCPVCGLDIELPSDIMDGELIEHDCGAMLEVKLSNGRITIVEFNESIEDWGE